MVDAAGFIRAFWSSHIEKRVLTPFIRGAPSGGRR
jgi:hypothetical protein